MSRNDNRNEEMTLKVKTNNGKPEVSINGHVLVNLEEQLIPGGDEAIEVPMHRTAKRDGKFYAKVAAYTLVVMGAAAGATYYITRRLTPGCESPEAMCEAANPGQLAVYYGQNNFSPDQGFVQPVMNYVGKWACATFVCGLANLAGNLGGLGGVFNALNRTTPNVISYFEGECNDTATKNNESVAQCFVSKLSEITEGVKEVCQYRLFGRRDVFGTIDLNVTSGNFTTRRVEVQNVKP